MEVKSIRPYRSSLSERPSFQDTDVDDDLGIDVDGDLGTNVDDPDFDSEVDNLGADEITTGQTDVEPVDEETNGSYSVTGFIQKLERKKIPSAVEIGWLIQNKSQLTRHQKDTILRLITDKVFASHHFVQSMGLIGNFLVTTRNRDEWVTWAEKNRKHKFSEGLLNSSEIRELFPEKKKKMKSNP